MKYDEFDDEFDGVENKRETPAEMRLVKYVLYTGFILVASFALAYLSRPSSYVGNENILKSDLQKTKIERGYELKKKSLEMEMMEKRD